MIGRPEKIFEKRDKTTARIPEPLKKSVQKLCIDRRTQLTDAINKGLEMWMMHQTADRHLKAQLDEALKSWRERFEKEMKAGHVEETKQETPAKSARRRATG